jgi:drug/metabolite transporter (DMT)-like permease
LAILPTAHTHSRRGIALKLAATLAFSLMYAVIKLAGTVPVGEVVCFRAVFAMVPLLTFSTFTIGPLAIVRTGRPLNHILRSAAGVSSMFLNFWALTMLPLADITAFSFVAPIFAVVLAALLLSEQVGPFRWAAVLVGFAGTLLMVEPHGGFGHLATIGFSAGSSLGAMLALSGAFLSSFVVVFIRQMSATERSETIVFYFMLISAIVGGATMIWFRAPLTFSNTFWLVMCGLLGGVGQICMTYCYRYAEPSLLAPFDYIAMVWAVALGYFIFAEVPEPMVMIGAGVVSAAGIFIVWRERNLHRAAMPETAASPVWAEGDRLRNRSAKLAGLARKRDRCRDCRFAGICRRESAGIPAVEQARRDGHGRGCLPGARMGDV